MPLERSGQLATLNFSDFTGGMNTAQPATQIADNEAQLIENYEYDYNRLRTRGGLSAPIITLEGDTIESFFYDQVTDCYLLFGATPEEGTAKVYSADVTNGASCIGSLTGRERPVCCKFGGEVFIASGAKLQVYDYETLTTIEGSYLCDNTFERMGRLVTTHRGDDILYYSSTGDAKSSAAWEDDSNDDSSAKFLEVGYKDDGDIITCKPMANDLIVFKTNGRIYSVSGEYPSWTVVQVGERSNAEDIQKSIEVVGNSIGFITKGGIRSLDAVQTYGNFSMNELGYKFNNLLSEAIYKPMCWNLISKRQLVIAPNYRDRSRLFVYQYNMGSGYLLTFPQPIMDMADTNNGIVVAVGNYLHRWGFENTTDNGEKIKTKLITRQVQTAVRFFTRKYDVDIEGEKDGAVLMTCGKQSWVHKLNDKRRVKHLYDTLQAIELELSSNSVHAITNITLYSLVN